MKKLALPKVRLIWAALAVFVATALAAVLVNGTVFGHGFVLSRSISRYVGYETWSAVVFAIGNIFVGLCIAKYLWRLGEVWKMPKLFYICIVLMVATLWALSVCPVGFCDFDGHVSLVSRIHEVSSRTMFIAMMLMSVMIALSKRTGVAAHVAGAAFATYAVICVAGYLLGADWFMVGTLIYESAYLVGFMLMLAICDLQKQTSESATRRN